MMKTDIIKYIKNVAKMHIKYSEKVIALEQSLTRKEREKITFVWVEDDYVEIRIGKKEYSYNTNTKEFNSYNEGVKYETT